MKQDPNAPQTGLEQPTEELTMPYVGEIRIFVSIRRNPSCITSAFDGQNLPLIKVFDAVNELSKFLSNIIHPEPEL